MTTAERLAQLSPERREALKKLMAQGNVEPSRLPIAPLPRVPGACFQLSIAQRRLWLLARLRPDDPSYNIPCHVRLQGRLDPDVLGRALAAVVARHEPLRTRFVVDEKDEPAQRIEPPGLLDMPREDLSRLDRQARENEVRCRIEADARQPFDLETGSPLRATLLRLSDEDHVLLLTIHHIVADGWSMGVLTQELASFYQAFARGEEAVLTPLAVQFADFAQWQSQWLSGPIVERQVTWWTRQLAGAPERLRLPTDRPRPAAQSFDGDTLRFSLGEAESLGLKRFAQNHGASLFQVGLVLYACLLCRWSGQDEVVIGSPTAGRGRRETEPLIGFFVNTLPLRVDLRGRVSLTEALSRLREIMPQVHANADLPFEQLVDALKVRRDPSRTPLFQSWFVLQSREKEEGGIDGLTMTSLADSSGTSKFDLTLFLMDAGDRIAGGFEYATALFDRSSIARAAELYQGLVRAALAEPDAPLDDLLLAEPPPLPSLPTHALERAPLSYHQERIWFVDHFETGVVYPEHPVYHHAPLILAFDGSPTRARLEECLNAVVAIHGALRTRVEGKPDSLIQVVEPDARLALRDLGSAPDCETAVATAAKLAEAPMPLDAAPLMRAGLVSHPSGVVLALALHHLVADRASLALIAEDLAAHSRGETPERAPDYAAYAAWQRSLPDSAFEPQLFHWRHALRGHVAPLLIPADRPRPAVHTYTGGSFGFRLPDALAQGVRRESKALGMEPGIVLLASFTALLHRLSGQEEIVVGTSVSCRGAGTERMVGPLSNLVVLRIDHGGKPGFRTLADRVSRCLRLALAHSELPFDRLVLELAPEKDMSRTALFDVLFHHQKAHTPLDFGGVAARLVDVNTGWGKYDLHLAVIEDEAGFDCRAVYNLDLYDAGTLRQMMGNWQRLLGAVSADPEQAIGACSLLSEEDIAVQRDQWTATGAEWPREATIHGLFEAQVRRAPGARAVGELSYRDLDRRANSLALRLVRQGVGPDKLVVLLLPRRPAMLVGILGVLKAGGAYLPLNPDDPDARKRFVIEDSGARHLVATPDLAAGWGELGLTVTLVDDGEADEPPLVAVKSSHLAYCIYTSGSTGKPKGVLIEHRNVVRLLVNDRPLFRFSSSDVWSLLHSLSFDFSVWETYGALLLGGRVALLPKEAALDPKLLLELLRREGVTVLNQTPAAFHGFARCMLETGIKLPALRYVIFGGEALHPARLTEWRRANPGVKLVNMYGITETTVHVTYREVSDEDVTRNVSNIGVPIPTMTCWLFDAEGRLVPRGVTGELWVGGDGLARGYLNREILTGERFRPNPLRPSERLYRSGDLARWLSDGTLEYLGRADQQVKLRGFRIEPGEIVARLLAYPGVNDAVVLTEGEQLLAWVASRAALDEGELRRWVAAAVPQYMVPTWVMRVDAIPLTHNGKVDRRALPASLRHEGSASQQDDSRPRDVVEQIIAANWCSVLELDAVEREGNFFDLGGHSLLATQMISRLNRALGLDLPARTVFEHSTLAALAEHVGRRLAAHDGAPPPVLAPADRSTPPALSFAQQRLWFMDRLEPDNPFYNSPVAWRLRGALDVEILTRVLDELVCRHEALRTSFPMRGGVPVQLLAEPAPLSLAVRCVVDEAEVRRLAEQEARRPFNLAQGPVIRATLFRLGERDHLLMVVLHHIVSDGWSLGVLNRELARLYVAFSRGLASPLEPLALQYADFAVWQRNWLGGAERERQLSFWCGRLTGAPPLNLPTDRPRPARLTYAGRSLPLTIPAELTRRLVSLSHRNDASLYMTLLASLMTLLGRCSGQEDVVVGSPIANRTRPEIENLIGFFVNTLALRGDLSGNPPFTELLARLRTLLLDAYSHQDIPFEQLIEELEPERNLNRNPLVQVMFALQNAPASREELPGLSVSEMPFDDGTVRFDLEVHLWEADGALQGRLIYATDLFDEDSIARLGRCFTTLLDGVASRPETRIQELPLLAEEDEKRLLVWAGGPSPYPRDATIARLFSEVAAARPDSVALSFSGAEVTYAELDCRAASLAAQLRTLGVGADRPVGLVMERSLSLVVGLLGILKAGGAYLPLDPDLPRGRVAQLVETAQPVALLAQPGFEAVLEAERIPLLVLDADGTVVGRRGESLKLPPPAEATAESLAYITFTSGSRGRPKGAMIPNRAVVRLVRDTDFASFGPQETFLLMAPLSFDASTFELWGPLLNGGRLAILPPGKPSLDELGRLLRLEKVTTLWLTAGLFHLVVDENSAILSSLRQLLAGGDVLSPAHVRRVRELFPQLCLINGYGPTENTTFTCCHGVTGAETGSVPIGRPIANTVAYVVDPRGMLVPPGMPGELWTGGDGLARGYLGDAELTLERFVPNPFASGVVYRTGDKVRWLRDGSLEFLGRLDAQFKNRGFRIDPGEIEAVLAEAPEVKEAAVVARDRGPNTKRLIAYVVPNREVLTTGGRDAAHVGHWLDLYEDTYGARASADSAFETVGWNSSYTGEPIPTEEMKAWLDETCGRILERKPCRVLEIGAGTGMILARVAPNCEVYDATDFSAGAIAHLRELVESRPELGHARLHHRRAVDFDGFSQGAFDMIVLNSVVQYFPSIDYLLEVLRGCAGLLSPGGLVFLGDLRNHRLLHQFHASVQCHRATGRLPLADLRQRFSRAAARERELLVDPLLFDVLPSQILGLARRRILPKGNGFDNELSRFRYDAVLSNAPAVPGPLPPEADWRRDVLDLARLGERLAASEAGLLVRRIPRAGLQRELALGALLDRADTLRDVSELREEAAATAPNGVTMAELSKLASSGRWRLDLAWSEGHRDGVYVDALFHRGASSLDATPAPIAAGPAAAYANDPRLGEMTRAVVPALQAWLQDRLPDWMLPDAYVLLPVLPLTSNGKVDRRALPDLEQPRLDRATDFVAPRNETERRLAAIWTDVLGVESVGIHDDFFQLGGHSLLATQAVSRLRQVFSVELPVRSIFENPTVSGLARALEHAQSSDGDAILPVGRHEALPLSFAQQRLWLLDRLDGPCAAYVMPLAMIVRGKLDVAALQGALDRVLARHEALRTTFREVDGEPRQCIAAHARVALEWTDDAAAFLARPFALESGPLLRAGLVRKSDEEHMLLLAMHHIVSDGWSLGILMRELAAFYRGARLPPLAIQYADFVVWQRRRMEAEAYRAQLAYWRRKLDGLTELDLPVDMPRAAVQTWKGGAVPFVVPRAVARRLGSLAQTENCSLFMALSAAFMVLMGRHAGQEDVALGTPIANRHRRELEPLIGFFVNTLVLRGDLSGAPTTRALLARMRQTTLEGYENQDVPFEQLVEVLKPVRSLNRNPLFQVMFALQNAPAEPMEVAGLSFAPADPPEPTARFDLEVHMREGDAGLDGVMLYNADLFCPETVQRFADRFLRLLGGMAEAPDCPVAELPLMTESEDRAVRAWSQGPALIPPALLPERFAAQARRQPDAIALICGDRRVSYGWLNARADALAAHLAGRGVGQDARVGVHADRSVEMVVALVAVLKAGGAYVPLDPAYPSERLGWMMDDPGMALILTRSGLGSRLSSMTALPLVNLDEAESYLGGRAPQGPRVCDLAYVLYTSGSTGRPKGVAIEHRGAASLIAWAETVLKPEHLRGVLCSTSICFDLSVYELFVPLCLGGTAVLVEDALDLSRVSAEVTLVNTVPSAMTELLRHKAVPPSVKRVNLAGEPLKNSLAQAIYDLGSVEEVWNLYGPTEDATYSTGKLVERGATEEPTIGVSLAGRRALVLDDGLRPVPLGIVGELWLGGVGLARGYLGRPDLTVERFVDDPRVGERLYRTGDLARWTADGELEYLGRVDHQVKFHGFRIELGEIETALLSHPQVAEAVVVARGEGSEAALVVYVTSRNAGKEPTGLREHLRRGLPDYMVPARLVTLDQMPLTPNGKIDRRALPAPPDIAAGSRISPRTLLEAELAALWCSLLKRESMGVEDDFFDLGGHSLLAARVMSGIAARYGVRLPLRVLFEDSTVAALARRLQPLLAVVGRNSPKPAQGEEEESILL